MSLPASFPSGSRHRGILASTGPIRNWSTSRCWNCSVISAPTASRHSSSPAAALSSCARGPSASMVSHRSRLSAHPSRRDLKCAMAGRSYSDYPRSTSSTTKPASPIAAFGNSDGDLEMLQWATLAGDGPRLGLGGGRRLGLIVHHTDAEREYAYDRHSHVGKLDKALDAAAINRWTVVDMKADWKQIFPPAASAQGVGTQTKK